MKPNVMRKRGGFTLIEIMIVVLIIGILLSIAGPNFALARERTRSKSCIENLSKIQWAKEQWAMEENQPHTATPTQADLIGSFKNAAGWPDCPSNGTYTINNINTPPTCSFGGTHRID